MYRSSSFLLEETSEEFFVLVISPLSRMCGFTMASIWGWGVRGKGSSSSLMKGVQVKPCLSFRFVFFFFSWRLTLIVIALIYICRVAFITWMRSERRDPRGVGGSDPLLSISSSSLGTILSSEHFNRSPYRSLKRSYENSNMWCRYLFDGYSLQ